MSLVAAQLGDRLRARTGALALVPLLLVGAATVVYWRATERAGDGNLVPYGALQLWAVGALAILVLQRSRYSHGAALFGVIATYAIAKLCEHFDASILEVGHLASGHTWKHVVAATGGLIVAWMLARRRAIVEPGRIRAGDGAGPLATSRLR
jgi:Zn-dependent protease with chaperone function